MCTALSWRIRAKKIPEQEATDYRDLWRTSRNTCSWVQALKKGAHYGRYDKCSSFLFLNSTRIYRKAITFSRTRIVALTTRNQFIAFRDDTFKYTFTFPFLLLHPSNRIIVAKIPDHSVRLVASLGSSLHVNTCSSQRNEERESVFFFFLAVSGNWKVYRFASSVGTDPRFPSPLNRTSIRLSSNFRVRG